MRRALWTPFAGIFVLLSLIGPAQAAETIDLRVPEPTGRHEVGTRTLLMVDRDRPAGFEHDGPRRLMVQVTYPRVELPARKCREARYMPAGTEGRLVEYIALDRPVTLATGACRGAPMIRRKLPLIMFSHAYTASRGVYATLVNDLASRGFIVAAVDHTYDAFAVQFPDGALVDGEFGNPLASKPITEPELVQLVNLRVRDVRTVTTRLIRRSLRRTWLKGRIDRARIGAFGHSLGGATAARVADLDRRFRASADLDGSLFGSWPLTRRSAKPFLLLVAEKGLGRVLHLDKSCRYLENARRAPLAWQLGGAAHLSFSDFQPLAPELAAEYPEWVFAPLYPVIIGTVEPGASVRAQRQALARFFRRSLRPGGAAADPSPPTGIAPVAVDRLACQDPES